MIVKSVTEPGSELYGLGAGIDADPINQKRYRIDEGFGTMITLKNGPDSLC